MKKRRLFSLFLSFALLLPLFSLTSADAYEDFDLDAKAGLLIEADTGEILYEKNAHQENFPASLTKVMVALLVFEAIDEGKIALTDSVTATESAFEGLSSDGSTANIVPGETMTVEQLLNCMLIVSANEACNILGETLYGSVDAFVARMNERAAELGCEHTHFANATGLHNSQHYTTAWDLYLITREALKHDKFMEICNSKSYTVPATNMTDKPRELHSTNFLISNWRAAVMCTATRRASRPARHPRRLLPHFVRPARQPPHDQRGAGRRARDARGRCDHPDAQLLRNVAHVRLGL